MTFAWPCLLGHHCVDPATKYHGHLLLSHIIAKFAIHKRIVLQVCDALFHSFTFGVFSHLQHATIQSKATERDETEHKIFVSDAFQTFVFGARENLIEISQEHLELRTDLV